MPRAVETIQRAPRLAAAQVVVLVATLTLGACASSSPTRSSSFEPARLSIPNDLTGVQSKTIDSVTVSVAILSDDQARRHFGADLAKYEVQAVWMSVRNGSKRKLWFIRSVLDVDYYSAEEVALLIKDTAKGGDFEQVRQYFRDESIRYLLLPGMITEGFVFVPRREGGRYLDVRLSVDAFDEQAQRYRSTDALRPRDLRFGFAVPLPDGDFDYERIDPRSIYGGATLPDLDNSGFRMALESLPCCATNADGDCNGDPLNVVIVGDANEMLNALSRSGWSFTHRISLRTVSREIEAAMSGSSYPVAPVSNLYAFGRPHDVALQRARRSIVQRNHMRLWLAPFRFEGRQVWIGQVSRDIGIKVTTKSPTLTTHVIDPEVDTTREYLLHSLFAQRLVERFGFVKGSNAASRAEPARNLTDDPYFSDGMRLVLVLSSQTVPLEQVRSLLWERSAAPIAEGQTAAAERNMKPIAPGGSAPP